MQQKNVYHAQRAAINIEKPQDTTLRHTRTIPAISAAAVRVSNKQAYAKRAGGVILLLCLALAMLAAVLVPLLVGGASPSIAAKPVTVAVSPAARRDENSYTTLQQAHTELGFAPALPGAMPEEATLTAIRVVNGTMLEMEYALGNTTLLYRTAQNSEDLSDPGRSYAFSNTEKEDEINRTFAGATEKKLSLVVWAAGGNTYAIQTNTDINADVLKEIALSVA